MLEYKNIIDRIKVGDPAAMELLYDSYGKYFYNYCVKNWGCDEDLAWEIVYRTLETLVLKLGQYEFSTQGKFDSFIFKVLMNYIRQYYRSAYAKNEIELKLTDFSDESLPKEINDQVTLTALQRYYEDEEIESPAISLLNEALKTLDKEDQDILLLRAQNYTYEEIAAFLKLNDTDLKVKYHRAKKRLIKLITDKKY